jgi:hypothetical protein
VVLAWVRSQMNMAPVDPAKNDKIIVASGKCNNAEEFAPFGIGFTPATRTYYRDDEIDVEEWMNTVGGGGGNNNAKKAKRASLETVVAIVAQSGSDGIKKNALVDAIMEEGVSQSQAYRDVDRAEAQKVIVKRKLHYHVAAPKK